MEKMKPWVTPIVLRQFILYIVMGGTATGIDWLSFYGLNVMLKIPYLSAITVSFTLGCVTNFSLNKYLNFKDKTRQIWAQVAVYGLVSGFSLLCTAALMYVLVEWARLWPMFARILTTGIMVLINFSMHKFVTYNQRIYARLG